MFSIIILICIENTKKIYYDPTYEIIHGRFNKIKFFVCFSPQLLWGKWSFPQPTRCLLFVLSKTNFICCAVKACKADRMIENKITIILIFPPNPTFYHSNYNISIHLTILDSWNMQTLLDQYLSSLRNYPPIVTLTRHHSSTAHHALVFGLA